MDEGTTALIGLIPKLREETARWKNCPFAEDDLVNGFFIERGQVVMNRYNPNRGKIWPFVQSCFWRYTLDQMKKWRSQQNKECPLSSLGNGHFDGWCFVEDVRGMSPEESAVHRERVEIVNAAIRTLNERDQALVVSRYHLGLHLSDIVTIFEFPTANAASQAIRRAVQKFAQSLPHDFQSV